jgi:serine/threonine protein kinase
MQVFRKRADLFGRYHLLENLGKGTGGRLFKAQDKTSNRLVILKVKRVSNLKLLPEMCKKIHDQFELLQAIPEEDHTGIVKYHQVVCIRYNKYAEVVIVMEYIPGHDLYQAMKAMDEVRSSVSVQDAYLFLKGSFTVLDQLHSRNVVHRDLKPENWMVSKTGLKLVDFDLACVDYPKNTRVSLPNSLACDYSRHPGTRMYFAPELYEAEQQNLDGSHLNAKSLDLWAQGVVAIDLFMRGVGIEQYNNALRPSPNVIDGKLVGGRYITIAKFLRSERITGTLKPFRPLLMKLLATDPEKRGSTQEVLRDLRLIRKKYPQVCR